MVIIISRKKVCNNGDQYCSCASNTKRGQNEDDM